ncbi:Glycosyl hydrolases family 39 [Granulicella pectinivorans]|uniref:Glycosyl hydrolases family 39 n=1 Tax=Granulicella pectinivorans TaxID=474950 RepID=A0A1I6MEL5_9BACT|nr:glycosyl hydrolase family 39 [Granulicella pectinivorans]SFS14145.1 Glycosyl hydrolases family 39 [Granulicella pectinivorans]
MKNWLPVVVLSLSASVVSAQTNVTVNWAKTIATSHATPTLQVVVNPQLLRGAKLHDSTFSSLHALGADYVRYVPWLPYPKQAVAELQAPTASATSWDFTHIDPTLDDFMQAQAGHSVVMNFSTIPAWMYKTDKPVTYPDDPNQVFWHYTQGNDLRDPSMKEAAAYFARLVAWYTQGGFTDELGKRHESGHHYHFAYWEVLNEIEFEHNWTPEAYTRFYDTVTAAIHAVDPSIKFMGLALGAPSTHPEMFEYFLNPANHRAGAPLDFITYHFYAEPTAAQGIGDWQYTFFDQAEGFLHTVRFAELIRKRLSPATRTDLNELGIILPEDGKEIGNPGYVAPPPPDAYWNLAGALYAYLYVELARIGIDVVGESQLVGYPSQYPSVSMMSYATTKPNARYWTLKLLHDHLGDGDPMLETGGGSRDLAVQAFLHGGHRTILFANKRNHPLQIALPKEAAHVAYVAPSTGEGPVGERDLSSPALTLEPFEVAIVTLK